MASKKKKISCFDKRGNQTREFMDIMDIAMTVEIAFYMHPETPKMTTMMETVKRLKKSPQNRTAWRQNVLNKYLKDPKAAMVAQKNAIDGYFELAPLRERREALAASSPLPINVLANPLN